MMASLYQSGSSSSVKPSGSSGMLENLFSSQDVGRQLVWTQFYIVCRPLPRECCARHQIDHSVWVPHINTQFFQRQIHETGLLPLRIQIHNGKNEIPFVRRPFAVADEFVVVDSVELQL